MILLITPFAKAQQCADAIQEATGEVVQVASSLRQAVVSLRNQEFAAVVMDQLSLEAEPEECDLLMEHLETAIPVNVNFAISGPERVIRELRAALRRRKKESLLARQWAEEALRNDLKGTVTALLLSCEMALEAPSLPAPAEAKMRTAHELARELRNKLCLTEDFANVR
jgi:hypothetical protein